MDEESINNLKELISLLKKTADEYDHKTKLGASFGLFAAYLLEKCNSEAELLVKLMASNESLMQQAQSKFKKNPGHGAQWQ